MKNLSKEELDKLSKEELSKMVTKEMCKIDVLEIIEKNNMKQWTDYNHIIMQFKGFLGLDNEDIKKVIECAAKINDLMSDFNREHESLKMINKECFKDTGYKFDEIFSFIFENQETLQDKLIEEYKNNINSDVLDLKVSFIMLCILEAKHIMDNLWKNVIEVTI